uniref:Uncharacterized protein n=1 Tax=Arundo donax TaxID=35708 RepID=A0A0A9CTF7_ARUDO
MPLPVISFDLGAEDGLLLLRPSAASSSVTWPPNTTFLNSSVGWLGRRAGDGPAPSGCGHASMPAVEVWELLTGAALSISVSIS